MSFVIYTKSKNGSTYAYQITSFRDPVTKSTRQKRVYLGKVDEETKQIIPKHARKLSTVDTQNGGSDQRTENGELHTDQLDQFSSTLKMLQSQKELLTEAFDQISRAASDISKGLSKINFFE